MRILDLKHAARICVPAMSLAVIGVDLRGQDVSWCPPHAPHTVVSGSGQNPLSTTTIARIDSAVAAEMRLERIPGLSVAVVTENQLRWERGYGFADVEACVPATPATVYRLASVSKTITASVVMQLAEQGRFDLDAPIQRYVPTFPVKKFPVTTRELLSHVSGIRHYQGDEELSVQEYPSLTAALAIFARDSLLHAPGARFTYSTYGYTLLGAALEAATGVPFVEYLRKSVLVPAGITTMRDDSVAALIPHRARGYSRDSSGAVRNAAFLNSSYKTPGGGLVSTAGDLARFASRLQSGSIVRPATFAQMATKARTTDGVEVPYGYGLIIGEIPDILPGVVWHGGVQQGFTTMVLMLPAEHIAVVALANMEGVPGSLASFTNSLARIVRDDRRREQQTQQTPSATSASQPLQLEIARMDSLLFAAFNNGDLARLKTFFAPDLEFYQDNEGLENNAQTIKDFQAMFHQPSRIRRELVPGTLEIYPIKNYGAIEVGSHRFCHEEKGRTECGTFKFLHVWRRTGRTWRVSRIVSYAH